MLLTFGIENFLSFDSQQSFTMEAASLREQPESVFTPPGFEWNYKLLKSVAFYGLNSSGKSNLLTAIALLKFGVLYSHSNTNLFRQSIQPYLLRTNNDRPSKFEAIFFSGNKKYRYSVGIFQGNIVSEALFYSEPSVREVHLFIRNQGSFTFNAKWNKETNGILESLTANKNFIKESVLFLSAIAGFQFSYSSEVVNWFERLKIIESFHDFSLQNYTAEKLDHEIYRHNIVTVLRQANLGFYNVKANIVDDDIVKDGRFNKAFIKFMIDNEFISKHTYSIFTEHSVWDENGNKVATIDFDLLRNESLGSRKFFGLIGLILEAMVERQVLLIDELDSQFHPTIFETLFTFFNKSEANIKGAQLIFTSHNPYLLRSENLRRDQLYNVVKNETGSSSIKRFHGSDNNVRADASVEKLQTKNYPKLDFNITPGMLNFPDE